MAPPLYSLILTADRVHNSFYVSASQIAPGPNSLPCLPWVFLKGHFIN